MKAWLSRNKAATLILIVLALLAALIIFNAIVNRASCEWYGYQTERETRYAAFVGCMVKSHNGWVPRAEIRSQQ